jgi:hypothetical protein
MMKMSKYIGLMLVMALFFANTSLAQNPTDKIKLTKGQKIMMTTEMKSDMDQAKRGKMKTDMETLSELEVVEVTDKGYKLAATMKKAKMKFEGFGMQQEYDSEDEAKQKGMMAGAFEKQLNKKKEVEIDFQGKAINVDEGESNGGMMARMGGDVKTAIEGIFLVIPDNVKVGGKWRTTVEKDDLKIITEYTFKGMMGNMANVTANQQTKGTVAGGRGGNFTTTVNQLTQMTLMLDAATGIISMKTIETKDDSSTEMGGETYKSSGITKMTITAE